MSLFFSFRPQDVLLLRLMSYVPTEHTYGMFSFVRCVLKCCSYRNLRRPWEGLLYNFSAIPGRQFWGKGYGPPRARGSPTNRVVDR